MKTLFDKDGNEIPKEDLAALAFEAVRAVKNENKDRLAKQIAKLANDRAASNEEFTRADALLIISVVTNFDNNHPYTM